MNTNTKSTKIDCIAAVDGDAKFDIEEVLIKEEKMTIANIIENVSEEESSFLPDCYSKLNYQDVNNLNLQAERSPTNICIKEEYDCIKQEELGVSIKHENKSEVSCYQLQETSELTGGLETKKSIFQKLEADEFDCKDFSLTENELDTIKHEVSKYEASEITRDLEVDSVQNIEVTGNDKCRILKCGLCEYKSKYRQCLTRHIKMKHENSEMLKCKFCGYRTKLKYYLQKHITRRHNENSAVLKCEFCNYSTKGKDSFRIHIKVTHNENCEIVKCGLCEYRTKWKSRLKEHIRIKHDVSSETFRCDRCEYSTKWKDNYRQHMNAIHDKNCVVFKCNLCVYTTKWKSNYKKHMNLTHDKNHEMLKCKFCEYKTKWNNNLKRHVESKHKETVKC